MNANTQSDVPATVSVAAGGRKNSLVTFSVIIVIILLLATTATVGYIYVKNGLPPENKETTHMTTKATADPRKMEFMSQITFSTGSNSLPRQLAVIDVNNDKRPDIIVANENTNSIGVFLNDEKNLFRRQQTYVTGLVSKPQGVSVADVNGDDKPDLIVANNGGCSVGVLFNYGDGTFHSLATYPTGAGSYPPYVTVADVNNDDKLDIVVANQNANNLSVLFNLGNGKFSSQTNYSSPDITSPTSPQIVDINDDRKPDIVFVNLDAHTVGILFNFGDGTFHSLTTYSTGYESRPKFVSVVDVNQDGKLDLVVANSNKSNVGVHLNSGDGTFLPQVIYSIGKNANPICVSVVDLNDDNQPEIIVVNHNDNNIGIFLNRGNGEFILEKTYSTGLDSEPESVSVVDVNGDNKPDIIVSNSNRKDKNSNIGVMLAI